MSRNKIALIAFAMLALIQLYIPLSMILGREEILDSGKEIKLRCAPVDPGDPFRGKYLTLRFKENFYFVNDDRDWKRDDVIFVSFKEEADGFAKIVSIDENIPGNKEYVTAKISAVVGKKIFIDYPFKRFYLDESVSSEAEREFEKSLRDSSQITFALINVKEGEAVVKDVIVNGVPVKGK